MYTAAIYVPVGAFPRYPIALVLGIASGAAMIPFIVMKEANPSQVKGTAAGVMNFLVFLTTGIWSPFISHLMVPSPGASLSLHEFQSALVPLAFVLGLCALLPLMHR